jgi:hypothetical protein
MHNTKKKTAEQTDTLIWDWKLRAECDSWNIPWAGNASRITKVQNTTVAVGGSFYLKQQYPELSQTQGWSFSGQQKFRKTV